MSISSKSINKKSKLSRHIQAALFGGVALNAGVMSFGVEAFDLCQMIPTSEQCNTAPKLILDSTDSFGNSTVLFDRQSPVFIGKNANVEDEGKIQRVKVAIQSPSNGENEYLEYDTSKLGDLLSTNASSSEVVTKHAIEVISLDASPSSIETFIKSIKYFNSVAWPTGASRTINVEVEDDRGSKASHYTIIDLQAGLEFDDYFTVSASSVVNGDKFLVNADLFQAADGSGVNLDEFNIGIYDRRGGLGATERFDNTGYGAFYLDSNKDGELTEDELLSNNNNSLNIKLSELNNQHVYFLHSGSEPAQDFQLSVLLSGQTPAGSESKVIKLPVSVIEADQPPQIISSSPKASQIELSLNSEMQAATERVIQIDPAGIPHVVYFEEETKKLIWSRYDNGAWVEIYSDLIEFSWDTRVAPKLKFHADGTAYVSYRNVDMYESPTIHFWRLKQTSSSVEHIILTEHDNPLVPSGGNDIFVSGVGPTYEGYDFVIDKNGALLVLAFDGNNTSKYNLYKLDGSGSQLSWARQEGFELPLLGREMGHYFVISDLSLVYNQNSDSLFYTAQESPPGSPSISAIGQFSSSEAYTNDYFNTDLGGLKTDNNYSYFSQLAQHIGNDDTPAGMHSLIAKRSHNSENSETEIYYQYVSNDESKKVVTGPLTLPNNGNIHQVTLGEQQVLFVDLEQAGEVSKVVVNRLVDEKWKSIYEYNLPFVAAKEFEVVTTPDGGLIVLTQDAQDNSVVHTSSIAGLADIELMEAISANSPQKPFEKIKLHDSDTELLSFVVSTEDLAVPGLYTLPDGFNLGDAEIEFTENGKGVSIKGSVVDINRILAALIFTPNADYQGTPTYIYTVQELPDGSTISGSLNIDIQSLVGLESLITASTLNIKEGDKMRLTEDLFQFDAINADVVEDFRFTLDAGSLGPVAVYYDYDGNGELHEHEKLTGAQLNQPWQYSDMQNSHYYFVHNGSESPLDFSVTINMSLIEGSNFKSSHKLSGTLTLPVKVELVDDAPVIGQKGQIGATEIPLTDEMLSASELVVEESAEGEIFAAYFNQASQQVTIKKFVDKQWQQVDIINTLGAHSSTSLQMRFDNNGSLYLAFISKAEANSADGAINKSALSVAKYNTNSGARDYHYQSLQDVTLLSDVFGFVLDEHGLPYVMVPNTLSESNTVTEASIFKLNDNSTPTKWQSVYAFSDKLFDDFRYSDEGQLHAAELKSLSLAIENGTIHYAAAAQMNMASATLIGKIVEDQGGLIHIIDNELGGKVKTADGESYMSSSAYISQAKAVNSVSGVHSLTSLTEFWQYTFVDYFARAYDGSDTYQVDRLKISNHGSVVALGSDTAYAAEVTSKWGSSTTRVVVYHVVDKAWEIYHEFELPFGSDPTSGELKFSGDNQLFYKVKDSTEQLSRLYKIGDVGAMDWSTSKISANTPSNILAGLQVQDPDSEEAVFTLTTDDANLPGTFSLPADFDKGAAIVEFTQNGKGVRLSGQIEDINRVLAALIFTPNSQYEGTPKYTYTVQGSSGDTETNGEFDLNIISYTELSSFFTLEPMNVREGGEERIRVNLFPSIDYQGDIWDDLTFLFDTQSLHSGDIYHDANGDGTIVDSEKLTEQELSAPRPLADILNGAFYFAHDGSESPLDFSILVDASLREGSEHSQRYSSSATFILPVSVKLVDDPIEFGAQGSNITTSEIPLTDEMLNADELLIRTSPSGEIHVIYTEDAQTATKLSWLKLVDGQWQNVADEQFLGMSSGEFQSISPQLEFADDGSAYLVHIQHGSNDEKSLSMIHYDAEADAATTYPLHTGFENDDSLGGPIKSSAFALALDENDTPYVMFHRDLLEVADHVIYKFQQNGDELGWAEYRTIDRDLNAVSKPGTGNTVYLPIKRLSLVVNAENDTAYYSVNMSGEQYFTDQFLTQGNENTLLWNATVVYKHDESSANVVYDLGNGSNISSTKSRFITEVELEQKQDALGNVIGVHSIRSMVETDLNGMHIDSFAMLNDGTQTRTDPQSFNANTSNVVLGKETPYIVEVTSADNGGSNVVIQHMVNGQWEVYQQYEVPFAVNKAPEIEITGTNQLIVSVEGDNAGETNVAITKDEPTNWAVTPINAAKSAQFFKDFVLKDDDADEVTFSVNTTADGLPGVFSLPEDFDLGTASIDFGDPDSAEYGKEVTITGTVEDVNRLIAALTFTPKDGYEGKPQYSYSLQSNTDDEPLTSNFDLNITDANTAPTRVVNKPIYVLPEREGHTQITIDRLKATDPDDNDAGIFYEIVELPESGLLRLTHSDGGSGLVETDLQVGSSFSQLDLMDNEAGSKLEYIVENGIRAGAFKLRLIDGGEDGVQPSEPFIVSLVDTKPAVSLSQTDINLSALLYENAFTTIEAPEFDAQSVTFGLYEVIDGICTTDVFAGIYLDGNALKADDLFDAGDLEICVVAKDDIWEVKQVFTLNLEDNLPVEAPSMPDLVAIRDSGEFNDDNITSSRQPTFEGTGPSGLVVELTSSIDGIIGSGLVNAGGAWSVRVRDDLSEGTHIITALARKGEINSLPSAPLTVTIEHSAPPIASGDYARLSNASISGSIPTVTTDKPVIEGVAKGFVTVRISLVTPGETPLIELVPVSSDGSWSYQVPNGLKDGTHYLSTYAVSSAGNSSLFPDIEFKVDTSAFSTPTEFSWRGEDGYINASELVNYQINGQFAGAIPVGDKLNASIQVGTQSFDGSATVANQIAWSIEQFGMNSAQFTNETEFKLTLQAEDIHGNTSESVVRTAKLDVVSPSVVIEASQSLAGANEPVRLLFSFSEPVASFTRDMISLQNNKGTLGPVVKHSSTSYSAIYTPAAGNIGQEEFKINAGRYFDIAGNLGQSASFTLDIDSVANENHSIRFEKQTYLAGDNEVKFTLLGLEAGSSYSYELRSSGGGVVSGGEVLANNLTGKTVTVSQLDELKDGELTLSVVATDKAGNRSEAKTTSATMDRTAPSVVSITANDTRLDADDKAIITITLSEPSADFNISSLNENGGRLSRFKNLSDTVYQVEFTPSRSVEQTGSVSVNANSFTDIAGNGNTLTSPIEFDIDTKAPGRPSVTFNSDVYNAESLTNAFFTVSYEGDADGFEWTLSNVDGGIGGSDDSRPSSSEPIYLNKTVKSMHAQLDDLADGIYTFTFVLSDDFGNDSYEAVETITLDNQKPTVDITVADGVLGTEGRVVEFTVSEAVTGFALEDISASSGHFEAFTSLGNNRYTAKYIPLNDVSVDVIVSVSSGAFTDAALNAVDSTTKTLTVDTKAPSVQSVNLSSGTYNIQNQAQASFSFVGAEVGATYRYTLTSSGGGTISESGTIEQANQKVTFTDFASLKDGDLTLNVTLTDVAGNTSVASHTATLDTVSPEILSLTSNDMALKLGEEALLTITLNEAVEALSSAQFSVVNGKLSDFKALSPTTYQAKLKPSDNVDGEIQLVISAGSIQDAAGNTNSEAKSLSITTDTSVPTGQSVTIDQAEINEDNDTALSFTLRGLEGSGLITYHISDGSNSVGSTSPIAITGTTQVISGIDVSSLAEGKLFLNVVVLDDAHNAAEAITASVIKAYNVAPTLSGTPASTINEDSEFVFEPLLNDPDTDNEHVFTINQTLPWATFDAQTGKLSGTPTDEHVGTYDNIQITVNDGRETFTLPAFSVEVVNTNDAPVAQNLAFDLNEAEQLIVAKAQGLIDTATDDDIDSGDVLKAIIVNEPQFGALVLNDDGSFTYSHDGSENHSDSFGYQIEDASGARSELRTVSLNMNAQADAPVVVDDFAQTLEDTQIIVKLLTNDSDAENDMVASSAAVIVEPKLGSYSIENGIITYTPNLNATGQDSLTYTVKDLAGNTSAAATLIIDITPVNDKPVAKSFELLVTEDTASNSIDLRGKSEDVEDINPTGAIALTATPTKGFVTLDQQTGSLVYTPNADAIGSDVFSYTIADSDGLISEPAIVTVNIGAVNDRPVVGNDTLAMTEDEVATLNILANDSDVEDQGFNAANVMLEDKGAGAGVYDMADVAVLADGTLEITPKQDANGRFSFTYTLVDSEQLSSESATVTVDITPVNDAPVALDNMAELFEEGSHEVNVLGNDSDVDENDTLDLSSVSVVKQPLNGQVRVTDTGAIVYVPNTNFNGDDTFTYTVRDAAGALSNEATVTMTVKPLNDAPVAQSQSVSLAEDGSLLITLAATDIDGDELSYQIVSSTASGSLTQQSVNTWTYAPNANFNGQDSLQFIAFDGQVESEPAQVTITVDAANDAPEISGAPATNVDQDVAYSFTPQVTDLDEDSLTFSVSNLPVWASFDAQSGTLSGTPGRDDVGSYTDIVITVSDGELTASLSPFAIEVGYVNAKPVAQGMDVFVNEDSTVSFSAPVSDADQDSLSISITEQPSFGSLTIQGQLFTYVPGANFNGSDSFSYAVNDGAEDSVAAQVAISVNPLNDAPVAQNDAFTFNTVSSSYTLNVLTNDTDVDAGDVLSLVGASASIGSVTIENGQLVYQPQATVQDTAVITYMIADPQGEQSSATATVDIVNNAAGSAGQLTLTTPQDKVVDATGLFTKVDLGSATATDGNGNPIAVSLVDGKTVFAPGLHHVYWKATDSNAQSIVKKQTLTVNPLISLSKDSQIAEEHTHTVKVFLNGEAPSYPVTVPYTISGTADGNDHDLIDGEVIINEGNEGVISFNVFGDGVVEGNETIVITLADTLNRGAKFASTVTIVEENVAPALSFETVQSGESRSLVVQSGGLVQVKASATDANPLDAVTYSWVAEDQQLGNLSTAADVFELDPKGLSAGIYKLSVTASDDGVPSLSSTVDVYLEVVESLPELGTEDSDGDLIPDSQEGFADTDNDGIPDYLDASSDCNVIPGQIKDPNQFLVEGEPGVCLRKGVTVAQNSTGGAQLLESELPADAEATNIGGLFDFIATGLPKEGDVYGIVIPQRKPIPVNAIYRKYRNGEWINFAVTDQDKILSAAGEPGYCPPPGSSEWRDGLNEGDWCVQLKIVDGGPNDDDGIANRSIVDPGGIAVLASDNILPLAQADSLVIGVSEPVFIDVLNNDTDADGDVLTITGASVDFGEVEVIDNQLKYTPPMNFVGTASITYSIADGKGGTASSTVTIELVVNNAPVTAPDSANTTDKSSLIIDVLSNDTDPDGDVLALVSAQANHGKATINSDGTLSYEPLLGFTGEDVVTYVVKDDKGATSEGIVKVSVTAHQSVSAQNSSSGSLGGLLVVMISALVIRRRSSKLPAYALITTACVMSSSAAAQQWRVQGTLGQAEARADFSALPTSTQITNIDDSSQSLSVGAFFQLMPSWNIGMRYIDLGQGRVNFSDSTVSPDSWQKTVSRVAPVLPEGFALQTGLEVFKHNKLHAELFLGAYGWDYSIESKTNTRSYTEYEQKGTSAYIGSAIGYELTDNVSAVLTYSYYRLSANRISEVAAGVEVRF
ncbi:tandem-95 repeat protein [Pseudoalteromonas umbrosa]|uniref:tandem-95 repeat protein n=1 Tax=Pseudoalteromonas umbrosa TaxID=3048489 RepID=UPI0024C29BA3|nr:tandem-95 repeat protein [Pseudoalteromonas sp. B95]MDK1287779.1 tandem-95 repeat protein [Pseudoalteromonas sp. B95]